MLPIRIFLISFSLLISGLMLAQKPAAQSGKDAPKTQLSTKKSSKHLKMVEARNQAFQEYSNDVQALLQKEQPSKAAMQQLEKLATDLYAEYPGHRFPLALLDKSGQHMSLRKQSDLYKHLLPKAAEGKGNSAAESNGFTGFTDDQIYCLIEYLNYGVTQDIPMFAADFTLVLMIPEHQAYMQNNFNLQSVCNTSHLYIADWNHNILSYFD